MASKQATLALLVLLALTVGASAGASASMLKREPRPTLVLLAVYELGGIIPTTGFTSNQTTAYATWAGKLYDAMTKQVVGAVYGVTTIVKGGQYPVFVSEYTHDLIGKGQVTTYGYLNTAAPANTVVITGGSDYFQGITGKVIVTLVPQSFNQSIAEVKLAIFAKIKK